MAGFSNTMAIVVATKDRPVQLRRLLGSIAAQDYQPLQIVIVNGGKDSLDDVISDFPALPIKYVEVRPPRLTRQKNAGVRNADPSATLIACMDDDVILEEGAMAAMMAFWEDADRDVGGASFNLPGDGSQKWTGPLGNRKREFGLVLPSGLTTPNTDATETTRSKWLVGGATVWRREVFSDHYFNEGFLGTGVVEDVDFSYPVGKQYKLYVVAEARANHLEPRRTLKGSFLAGKALIINRVAFVKKNQDLSLARCYLALGGRLLGDLGKGVLKAEPLLVTQAMGNVIGFAQVLTGKLPRDDVSSYVSSPSAGTR